MMMMLAMALMLKLMKMATQPVSVDEKVFHAVAQVLGSILRDVKSEHTHIRWMVMVSECSFDCDQADFLL